jgi:NADPH-dependent 2,4-dienoyl-CoA reductase/sulfur reductase-like enzyme
VKRVVIVGASAAGLAAAEALRAEGFGGSLTMVGAEARAPYDRPPLSKQIMVGTWEPEQANLRDASALEALGVEWRLGMRATALDAAAREVALADGTRIAFDGLIIATGVRPRRLPGPVPEGVHVLRDMEDALALRVALASRPRVAVVGAGALGTEFAAAARMLGLQVTLFGQADLPMRRQFGPVIGRIVAEMHQEQGVVLRPGVQVTGFEATSGRVTGLKLSTGEVCAAELVLIAIGAVPETEWLTDSGLVIHDGVECDAFCMAAPKIYAAGDVARWFHRDHDRSMRVEHRMNAAEQGMAAARNLLGACEPFRPIPFLWSDQFHARIQSYGFFPGSGEVSIEQDGDKPGRFVAFCREGGRLVGVLGWNAPRALRAARRKLAESIAEQAGASASEVHAA